MDGGSCTSFSLVMEKLSSGRMVEVPNYLESVEKGELVPQVKCINLFICTKNYNFRIPCVSLMMMSMNGHFGGNSRF